MSVNVCNCNDIRVKFPRYIEYRIYVNCDLILQNEVRSEIIGMDTESRTCKYFALKRTCSKYVAGRVVNILPHLFLPHSGIAIFCSFC